MIYFKIKIYYFILFINSNTEERAQMAEASVSDLEFQLKEALEKIRKLERHMGQDDANLLEDSSETVKSESNLIKII